MQRNPLRSSTKPSRAGFTLLEMVLGLTILVLVFGVMFRLLDGSLMAMGEARRFASQHQETTGVVGFFRAFCMELPRESAVTFRKGGESIRFTNSQIALLPGGLENRVLEFYRDKKTDQLMLRETVDERDPASRRPGSWVEFCLATNVTGFSWTAHDPRSPQKVFAEWVDPNRPAFLSLDLRKDGENVRADFWVPSGLPAGGAPTESPSSSPPPGS